MTTRKVVVAIEWGSYSTEMKWACVVAYEWNVIGFRMQSFGTVIWNGLEALEMKTKANASVC